MTTAPPRQTTYVLDDSDTERRRLRHQADLLGVHTRRAFERAGIVPGMHVLDLGSGPGDVALLAADMVGPTGSVLGVDVNPTMTATAAARAAGRGHGNVRFVTGDVHDITGDGPLATTVRAAAGAEGFDAVVGRLVLMYMPDPVQVLADLATCLRPGGVLTFQEADFTFFCHAAPAVPLVAEVHDWIVGAFAAGGIDPHMGFALRGLFTAAGLPAPDLQFDTALGGGADFGGYALARETVRSLLPVIERAGIATAEHVAVDTLADRLRDQAVAADATMATISTVAAWTTVPARV